MLLNTFLILKRKTKNIFFALIVLSTMLLFSGCEKEKPEYYYYALGNIHITTDSTVIISDDDEHFLVTDRASVGSDIKDNDRVHAYFTIKEKKTSPDSLYIIDLYSIEKILLKPVFVLTPGTVDSIGNDPMEILSLWITKNYLNLNFRYFAYNQKHFINITRQEGNIPVDTIDLEIRHNNNNDNQYYKIDAFVTFDIASLQNTLKDSVILHITAKEFYDETYEKYLTYRY